MIDNAINDNPASFSAGDGSQISPQPVEHHPGKDNAAIEGDSVPSVSMPIPGFDRVISGCETPSRVPAGEPVTDDLPDMTTPQMPHPAASEQTREANLSSLSIAVVEAKLDGIHSSLEILGTRFEREVADQSIQRSVIEKLHREMLDYKEDFLQKAMEPMFRRLIGWADHFEEILAQEDIRKDDLTFMYDELIDALDRYGVEQFATDGTQFDSSLQKIVKVEVTSDATLNRVVARRISSGYRSSSRIVRPEPVVAYKFVPPTGTPGATSEMDSSSESEETS